MTKTAQAFRTISEVSDELDVPKHVLRFWELKFPQIKPMKRGGGRRYYRPEDIQLLNGIRHLLHAEAYTIKGVQKILRERGVDAVKAIGSGGGAAVPEAVLGAAAAKATKGRRAARRTAGAAQSAAASLAQARDEAQALSPRASKVVELAISELTACRDLLRRGTPTPASAGEPHVEAPAARQTRR